MWILAMAGIGAGVVNGVVGGGTLVSFPALLAVGYPPLTANVTSSVGIWSGYVGGAIGFNREVSAQRSQLKSLAAPVVLGAVAGGALLLTLPGGVFATVVPYIILAACLLFGLQPLIAQRLGERQWERGSRWLLRGGTFACSMYGAYFGAGAGIVLLAVFGFGLREPLVRLNGLRSVVVLAVNTIAVIIFSLVAPVAWRSVAPMVAGSLAGGYIGARVARTMPSGLVRMVVVAIGLVAATSMLAK